MNVRTRPTSSPARATAFLAALAALASAANLASADELRVLDPATGEVSTERTFEIVEETWTETAYRSKEKGPLKRVPTRLVVEVKRSTDDPQFRSALDDLSKGAYRLAAQKFARVAGGGLIENPASGAVEYKPFTAEGGKPKWYQEAAHYYFAEAMWQEGVAKKDAPSLEYALRALEASSKEEKGFLVRYKDGKSRSYGRALDLKARILLAMGRKDDALSTWQSLGDAVARNPLSPEVAYWAARGPGLAAEAAGNRPEAEAAYEAGTGLLVSLLETAPDRATSRETGRWFNELRMQKARVIRESAEKSDSPSEFKRLRDYLAETAPDRLRAKLVGKKPDTVDSVVAGAMTPSVQAIVQNGLGLSYWKEQKYVDALFALNSVRVKYFQATDEVPRALYYLERVANDAAAAAAKPGAKALYEAQAKAARQELERAFADSPWASRK